MKIASHVICKIIAFLLIIFCSSIPALAVDSVIFTRKGLIINLKQPCIVENVKINGDSLKTCVDFEGMEKKVKRLNLTFDWLPLTGYEIKIRTGTGNILESAAYSPAKGSPLKLYDIKLGRLEADAIARINDGHIRTYDDIAMSPDNKYFAIAAFDHSIRLFELSGGKELFRYKISDGMGRCIAFSNDGKYLLAGESSLDGYLLCFEVSSGNLHWRYPVVNDVGTMARDVPSDKWREYYKPGVKSVLVRGAVVYARASRHFTRENRSYHVGKIYAFDIQSGQILWQFPQKGVVERSIGRIYSDQTGKYLVFTTYNEDHLLKERASIYVLNGKNGKVLWSYRICPLKPYFEHSTAYGGGISSDGRWITVCTGDGRVYLFDNFRLQNSKQVKPIWLKKLSTPILAGGVSIRASASYAYIMDDGDIIYVTGSTYTTSRTLSESPPIEHPNSHSLFCFDTEGNLKWRWTVGGTPSALASSLDGRYLAVSAAHDTIAKDVEVHGIYCLDLAKPGGLSSKLLWSYRTDGICVACGISHDARYIVAIEAPIDINPFKGVQIIGEHRIHVLE